MAADSQQQAGTSQGEQLIKLIRATEPQVQTGSAEVNACAYVLPRCSSGLLQFVLVTDWSDANTIKIDKPEEKLHHEAWRKGTNKVNFCGNVRLPYSQGKYYKHKPSVRFTW